MITFNTQGVEMPWIEPRRITRWVEQVAASYGRRVGKVNYVFMDDEGILAVNRQYLGHDYYTDIITFDYDQARIITTYDDELHRVIIHGILHLCGINDKGPGEREIMEAAENRALEILHNIEHDRT